MDIYEYLEKDHKKVSNLFQQLQQSNDYSFQLEAFQLIAKLLFLHAESEHQTFYKHLEQFEACKQLIQHADQEHEKIELIINKLQSKRFNHAEWMKIIRSLKELVEHHVADEESRVFEQAKKYLSKDDAWILKEKMHDYKDKLLMKEEKSKSHKKTQVRMS